MNLDKMEVWVHDNILKNPTIRHAIYGIYQRALYVVSPKIKFDGEIKKLSPNDGYEYLFGYYDKCPWDETGRYILALRVKSATVAADSKDKAELVIIDLKKNNKIQKIATTRSWNVQQGCMAQWLDQSHVMYNDFRDGNYCTVILDLEDKSERIIRRAVYAVSADKKIALSLDFSRLHRLRPGYGYANIPDRTKNEKCPQKTCIWKINIETGEVTPLLKYTDFMNFEKRSEMEGAEHKVNHLMISPNGKRFMVLHRWFKNGEKYTRLVTCNMDGTEMYNLSDDNFVSHCCWKNNEEILSYLNKKESGKGYYLIKDKSKEYKHMWPSLIMDGHPTYSYDGKYVVTDTYPDRRRIQSIYVMDGKKVKKVAKVFSPFKYGGDVRCDLHPRWSKDGKQICFDGSFDGKRGIYAVDTSRLYYDQDNVENKNMCISPKVSIIIPCYDCAQFIDETLESLENQTFKNFEVICINDGSKDDTLEKLKKWEKSQKLNIKVIDQSNSGVSRARNNGIKEAQGEYILFLDSDDWYHENYVEFMLSGVKKADVAYCKLSRKQEEVISFYPKMDAQVIQNQEEAMHNLLYRMGELCFCNYIYNRKTLVEKNIFFDENTKFGEDREFNWKYLCHCKSAIFMDMPLYWYRVNKDSATKGKASWRKTDLLTAVKRIEKYLEEQECGFSKEFNSYMYARAMWAVAKTFSVSKDRNLYKRLIREYPVRKCMKRTAKDSSKLVAFASMLYLVNPVLFFKIVGLKK
ncbi:glycosyltransferase family A protein [Dorea formicigenerans]|uniref:Glycosyltransferase n=1 Tax=Dorea formicigenerans TaxID=39486 RepID=A0A413SIK8_9FIRM|nr:glycosyltransferase family A protein [Dorea formicigenerans]RHA67243.1 glycosyltransferase [Dorea formicigenerans]